jgi:hypothetical protein
MSYLSKIGRAFFAAFFIYTTASAAVVTELTATYRNGQVFLTWNTNGLTNKTFKVYRNQDKIAGVNKLNSSIYLGYVKDNSSKNIRKSNLKGSAHYFKIEENGDPLSSLTGLYVVTCSDYKKWFYAVTVVDNVTGEEDKTITVGGNSLSAAVKESKASPKPVLQNTLELSGDAVSYEYVIWGNNKTTTTMPAFNNAGSFGYNFTFIQNSETEKAVYLLFRDEDPFNNVTPDNCTDCNVLLLDDWLPNGKSTYWFGYNENYDIYSSTNPVRTTGIIRSYTQARIRYTISWMNKNLPIDSTRLYTAGFSHNGFGSLLTAQLIPEKIAAQWITVAPPIIKAFNGSDYEKLWCDDKENLATDVINPVTGVAMNIWDVFDMRGFFVLNYNKGLPFIGAIHGKQDVQVGWVQQLFWYDSLEFSHQGGVWYWDQRQHGGSGKQYLDDEIKFDLKRFSTAKSYPAYSYCSINQDPGNGSKTSGDAYGAINGYLDWDDVTVNDNECDYSITCFIKDMYVGGVLQPQFDYCTADVTLRRLQHFKPNIGKLVNWEILNSDNQVEQSGNFIFDGSPIQFIEAPIFRTGSTISLSISGCNRTGGEADVFTNDLAVFRSGEGYTLQLNLPAESAVTISVVDLTGRIHFQKHQDWNEGINQFALPLDRGEYIVQVSTEAGNYTRKLFF